MSSCESSSDFGVVLFHSVQGALGAEKILIAEQVPHKLISVPRHISSNCGFCLRFAWADRERVEELLPADKFGIEGIIPL